MLRKWAGQDQFTALFDTQNSAFNNEEANKAYELCDTDPMVNLNTKWDYYYYGLMKSRFNKI